MKRLGILLTIVTFVGVFGCGSKEPDVLNDKAAQEKAIATGAERREIFLRAGGEYDKMSADDKKKYLAGFGDEEAAKLFWNLMKNPPSDRPGR